MNTELSNALYINSFYKHPFLVNSNNVRAYILMKQITEMIESEYGYKDFDRHLKPEDLEIEQPCVDSHYFVTIPNKRYDETRPNRYNNPTHHTYRFWVATPEEREERIHYHIIEHICYIPANILFDYLRDDAVKALDIEPREPPKTIYHNESCPVCLEDYCEDNFVDKKVALCGHCLCYKCWNHIINSNNSLCPECREVWDEASDEIYIKYDIEDIEQLCDSEDNDTLREIINHSELIEGVILIDGEEQTLGYEESNAITERLDIPYKYQQLLEGEKEFTIFWERQEYSKY